MLRIKDWDNLYENNRTRGMVRMQWVPIPNSHDGDGYTELMAHRQGLAHFGAWVVLLQVASRCTPRGTLVRSGGVPHDVKSLARISRAPEFLLEVAIKRLLEIGWLEEIDTNKPETEKPSIESKAVIGKIPQGDAAMVQERAAGTQATDYGTEWNGMEGNGTERKELGGDREALIAGLTEYLNLSHLPKPDEQIIERIAAELGNATLETFRAAASAAVKGLSEPVRSYAFFVAIAKRARTMHETDCRQNGSTFPVSRDYEARPYN